MASFHEYRRRSIIPLAGVGLAAYYFLVLVPLDRKSMELDEPVRKAWKELAGALKQTNAVAIDFRQLTNQLIQTQSSLRVLQEARLKAFSSMELNSDLRQRLASPFQLVEYQISRSQLMDALVNMARSQQVTLEPAVLAGFPEHTVEVTQPELLWAALTMVRGVLTTAIQCKVTAIHSIEVPTTLTNSPSSTTPWSVSEIPLNVELTGQAQNVEKWLQSLPSRGDELRKGLIPEAPADKPPMFFDRLLMRKLMPEKPDEVRVTLRLLGYVLRE